MLFATLILDREPLQWGELPLAIIVWLQNVGLLAAIGTLLVYVLGAWFSFERLFDPYGTQQFGTRFRIWYLLGPIGLLFHVAREKPQPSSQPRVSRWTLVLGTCAITFSWMLYLFLVAVLILAAGIDSRRLRSLLPSPDPHGLTYGDLIFAGAGALSILVVVVPVVRACFRMRLGRIWAVAKLSIKESIRNGAVAVFGAIAIIFLFADWFIPYKPEDQVRNYVWVLYWSMIVLFLLSAGIFGSFSIPLDIKNQTIHTVVTKPITKFEVVLGRFFGYGLLLTIALFAVGLLSMGYVMRGVTQEARAESLQARVPIYGNLRFVNTNKPEGDSVGREWDYRRYISGQNMTQQGKRQYAMWMMPDLSDVRPRENGMVCLEYGFDIFRLTKGDENKDIVCSFKFAPGDWPVEKVESKALERQRKYDELRDAAQRKAGADADPRKIAAQIEEQLVKEHPVFQLSGVPVTDYHTQSIEIPFTLVQQLRELDAKAQPDADGKKPVPMQIFVSIEADRASAAQMLGVAPRDLYILAAEKSFYVNFLKGLVGLWFCTLLVLGVAICCSTYLSGVISLLCTMFLLLAGFFMPSIVQMANNQSIGGGPAESLKRIVDRNNLVTPLEDSTSTKVIHGIDNVFRWAMRCVLTVIPDASRYDLHVYVANGFDVSVGNVLFLDGFVPLVAYLLPWFVLAFYLINYREIANPT